MKAPAFDYARPTNLAEALALLARHGDDAKLIAGGQSLLPALNLRLQSPAILIDIGRLDELRGIADAGDHVRLGALARHAELLRSPIVAQHAPLLVAAIRHVAHPAIRNRGTIGGNLAHADPASELPACAVALRGRIVVAGPDGERRVDADAFFRGVYETALDPVEILVAVEVPKRGPEARHAFHELARRGGDYALAGIACTASLREGRLSDIRPVFFSVGPRPTLATRAAAALEGRDPSPDVVAAAQAALANDLQPEADLQVSAATRLQLARVLLGRAVADLAGTEPLRMSA